MIVQTTPVLVEGAPARPDTGGATIPAGTAVVFTWAVRRRRMRVLVNDGLELQAAYNRSGIADEDYDWRVTGDNPLDDWAIAVATLWLHNPGAADIVLSGAGKNGSAYGWA